MANIHLHLFKDSFGPFVELLNEHRIRYQMRQVRADIPMASSSAIELIQGAALAPSLAAVICAFLKSRRSRKVIITTNGNLVIHAEGLSIAEIENLLRQAKSLTAIESKSDET